jgi:hypothetical protein
VAGLLFRYIICRYVIPLSYVGGMPWQTFHLKGLANVHETLDSIEGLVIVNCYCKYTEAKSYKSLQIFFIRRIPGKDGEPKFF